MKYFLSAIILFFCITVNAMQFKIDGSYIYYKADGASKYDDFDYVILKGCGYLDGEKFNIFEDKSNIKKVVQDRLHKKLFIDKENSKWIMDYNVSPPYLWMIEPEINDKRLERNYIEQIYP